MKKLLNMAAGMVALMTVFAMLLTGCGSAGKVAIDYADAESFEAALNAGENLEGKVVQFTAQELHPDSAFGYNVWAGEHLNFVSSRNPDIKAGDTVVVKTDTIQSSLGSWLITYEKVSNAEITDQTISAGKNADSGSDDSSESAEASADSSGANQSSFSVDSGSSAKELPLELKEYGWFVNETSDYDDTAYVEFCTMIYNPNEKAVAEFPKALVTVKNGDGSILATEEQVGNIIMPGDTITLCGMFSMPVSDLTDDAQILFDVECSDFGSGNSMNQNVYTTDFEFMNVSERSTSDENFITGEVKNNSDVDVDMANVSIVLRKEGEIVYMENTFLDGLKAGKTKAFEFSRYHEWPEHDTIDCSAMVW